MLTTTVFRRLAMAAGTLAVAGCAASSTTSAPAPLPPPPDPESRVGLKAGLLNAGEGVSNMKILAKVPSPPGFFGVTNSDLAFTGNYAIQGNYAGLQIWDISNRSNPTIVATYPCPASQNDVSVYRNLLFMSSEGTSSRADCMPGGIRDSVSKERVRGVRIFDISDVRSPRLITAVQTCRGSHTHTVVEDPKDRENIYIYVSGSSRVRSPNELPGCTMDRPEMTTSSLWRIEVIKVPLANPALAAIVNRANIFNDLKAPAAHGEAPEDIIAARKRADSVRAAGGFVAEYPSGSSTMPIVLGGGYTRPLLDSIARARGATTPNAADSAALRAGLQPIINRMFGVGSGPTPIPGVSPISVNRQCHDITVYPALNRAGGACEGHGFLLDITDPANPRRLHAVSDSNFAYWHSATFNNDGTKILFSDEWGGGGGAKCRVTDKKEWGSDAIFEIVNGKMEFRSYYKLPAPQSSIEACVAHNGSLIPIPGRDVMVQSWYEGGISVFDWTDARRPQEIAYFDRGPSDTTFGGMGSWSVYWYNGAIVNSEIGRGLDIVELTPSVYVSQNEIDAANTVKLPYFNAQGQPKFVWPPSFPLAKSFVDQLERHKCMAPQRVAAVRAEIARAEQASGAARRDALQSLSRSLETDVATSCDKPRVRKLQTALQDLAAPIVP